MGTPARRLPLNIPIAILVVKCYSMTVGLKSFLGDFEIPSETGESAHPMGHLAI